jgi:DNA-binding SARP family transcriptional activator
MGLNLLGPLELVARDRRVEIGPPRTRVALAVLALNANRLTSVDQLVDAIWDASPPATARAQVQVCVSALRKVFANSGAPLTIRTQAAGYLLEIDEADLDVVAFDRQVEVAQALSDEGLSAGAAETLRGALGLWRGPALAGVRSSLVERRAAALEERRMAAVESLAAHDLDLGRHDSVITDLRPCIAEYPWRERLYALLALGLYRSGRQAEALEACRRARAVLAEEHGVDPGAELQALEQAILNQDRSLDLNARVATDAAAHRQEQQGRASVPRQLPAGVADFTGRQEHIATVAGLLSADRHPAGPANPTLVAISGPGGVGKSSLASHLGHELAVNFPDGQLFVDFHGAGGQDVAAAALAAFLRALGFDESVIPDDADERAAMYRSRLAGRRLLVVLDGAAHEGQVEQLLPGSNECAVIVTSRSRLGALSGAYHIGLEPLDVDQSIELLRRILGPDRVDAEYAATIALANLCDGHPLALRIAGARLASRPHWLIGELAVRMADETRRLDELTHHGVEFRSAVATSYQSLEAPTRRLFRLLSLVRAPDFPDWVAAALLDAGRADGADLLDELVDVQLLTASRPGGAADTTSSHRYRFHELVRMYAAEQLASADPPAERDHALRRLVGGWVALVEDMHRADYGGDFTVIHGDAPRWRPPDGSLLPTDGNPYSVVDVERRAIVAAVRAAADAGLDDLCWDLAHSAIGLFELKGYYDDWRETSTSLWLRPSERATAVV